MPLKFNNWTTWFVIVCSAVWIPTLLVVRDAILRGEPRRYSNPLLRVILVCSDLANLRCYSLHPYFVASSPRRRLVLQLSDQTHAQRSAELYDVPCCGTAVIFHVVENWKFGWFDNEKNVFSSRIHGNYYPIWSTTRKSYLYSVCIYIHTIWVWKSWPGKPIGEESKTEDFEIWGSEVWKSRLISCGHCLTCLQLVTNYIYIYIYIPSGKLT